jgi:adenylosuccinate synthase
VFGGQVGSEGKGAVVGYLARRQKWGAAVCTFMTNAGHTWIGSDGEKVMTQQLPVGLVGEDVQYLLIAPGSAITLVQLEKELLDYDKQYNISRRLRIHPRTMIIDQDDIEYEKEATKYLGSTSKGCGAALARKAMRVKGVRLARDINWLKPYLADTTELANDLINHGYPLLIEGSQGFDLDINHGIEYPYCTSRGTTPMQVLADCGISERCISDVIAVLRTYPIRVGNVVEGGVQVGYSGNFGGKELTWEEVTERSGSPVPLIERTTVTQRVRRVFEIDIARIHTMVQICRPTTFALTFADYIDYRLYGQSKVDWDSEEGSKLEKFIEKLYFNTGVETDIVKTGPLDNHTIDSR